MREDAKSNFDPLLLQGLPYKKGEVDYRTLFAPNNNIKLYDSKDTYNRTPNTNTIVCYVNCDNFINNNTGNNLNGFSNNNKTFSAQVTMDSNPTQPFTYEDSNIAAKEIINKDNTSTLVIESNTNLLEYQGNTTDTLMSGISGVFASMATLAEKYGVDKSLKESTKGLGTKGRILASVLFQARSVDKVRI